MLEQIDRDGNLLLALFVSQAPDTQKRDHFLSETLNNQDNHSAWLIHIKNVIKEDGDETLENEEPTARCNAINIIPKVIAANEDDVVIVQEVKKTKTLLQKMKEVVDFIMNTKK